MNLNYKSIHQKFKLNKNIKVFKGPEFNSLSQDSINQLLNQLFSIGINNRMAYNLKEKNRSWCSFNNIIRSYTRDCPANSFWTNNNTA